MAVSLDELFSERANTAVVAAAVAAAVTAAAKESPDSESVSAPLLPKEGQKEEVKQEAKDGVEEEPKEQVIELRVPICCEGCVEKIEKKLILTDGVVAVECDMALQKVIVRGTAKLEEVLGKARKIQKRSQVWTD